MNILLFQLLLLYILSFGNQTSDITITTPGRIGYNLSSPDKVYVLPSALHEISGITEIDASSVACIQDEYGLVFIFDTNKNQIIRELVFGSLGDYEDLARVDKSLFILRSDETLIEITDLTSDKIATKTYPTAIPGVDCEGLCYDKKNNRLLIVPKENTGNNPENKGKRFIYGFDLSSKKLIKNHVFRFDIHTIEKFAIANNIKVPMKGKKGEKEEPDIKLRISAIGIHPLTSRMFVISGPERILFVFNIDGNIEFIERLNRDLFPQPEGITFMKNGDMLISNEGKSESPTLVRFNYKPGTSPRP